MAGSARVTRKVAASIIFGLGSFILMADATQTVITKGDEGGNIIEMGFPSLLGYVGIILWIIGISLLVSIKIRERGSIKENVMPIFLKGSNSFRCRSCKTILKIQDIDYSDRIECECGAVYDVYKEPEST